MPRVVFQPGSRAVDVPAGERLLTAAWKGGVGIKSVCGGRGRCSSCLVELDRDATAADALSPACDEERALLPRDPGERVYRLACMAHVRADAAVVIPPESEAVRSPPRKPYTVSRVTSRPVVRRVTAAVEPASMDHPVPLDARLERAIAAAAGTRRCDIPVAALAEFSRVPGFDTAREVTATLYRGREAIQLLPGRRAGLYGVAVDIGTTSVVVFLCDLERGEILSVGTAANPQALYGEDVISRMTQVQREPASLDTMRRLMVDELNRLIGEGAAVAGIAAEDIVDAVAVGNPTMQHILLGLNPEPLGRGPYLPIWSRGATVTAGELGLAIARGARVFVFPMPAGYIGGDTLAALLTRGPEFYRGRQLLVDIGTNGEVVLAHDGALAATSCATGPVYEGAHIRCGVRAAPGAIERVWVDPDAAIRWSAIPEADARRDPRPVGLCGSGVISSVAALVDAGILGADGAFAPPGSHPQLRANGAGVAEELVLVPARRTRTGRDLVFTQKDVRNVQLGKAALRAGIELLLKAQGVDRLDRVYLAGTFGNHLEPEDILRIGLVPPVKVEHIRSIGNAAGDGARMALFDERQRRRVLKLAQRLQVLELSTRPEFQDVFVASTELTGAPLAADACG